MQFATGKYTGTGYFSERTIEVGFKPDLVIVKRSTDKVGVWRSASIPASSTYCFSFGDTGTLTGRITAFTSTGFKVRNAAETNQNGGTYYWVAWQGTTPGEMAYGTYSGNGVDSREISALGFPPDLLIVKGPSTAPYWRSIDNTGDVTMAFAATADAANLIQALQIDGFQLGDSSLVNGLGSTYHYFAIMATVPGYAASGYFTGDGNDNRAITGLGFPPNCVIVKSALANYGRIRTSDETGDKCLSFSAVAEAANLIQSLDADGFTVGTDDSVNKAATLIRWFAWKTGVAVEPEAIAVTDSMTLTDTAAKPRITHAVSDSMTLSESSSLLERTIHRVSEGLTLTDTAVVTVADVGDFMLPTLKRLISLLRIQLNDVDEGNYPTSDLIAFINQAYGESVVATKSHKDSVSLDIVAGTHTYDHDPIFEPIEVSIAGALNKKELGDVAVSLEAWDLAEAGTPTDWMQITGSQIRIHRAPGAAVVGQIRTVNATPTAQGTGYSVDDVLTIAGGTGGTVTVTAVNATKVTAVELTTGGYGYTTGSGKATTVSPTGGTGCTIEIETLVTLNVYGYAKPDPLVLNADVADAIQSQQALTMTLNRAGAMARRARIRVPGNAQAAADLDKDWLAWVLAEVQSLRGKG